MCIITEIALLPQDLGGGENRQSEMACLEILLQLVGKDPHSKQVCQL